MQQLYELGAEVSSYHTIDLNFHYLRYHLPRSWLNPTKNLLVVLEEWGGDPTGITLVKRVREMGDQQRKN